MSVFVSDRDLTIHVGDVLEVLPTLETGSVDCVVTSPPYWGLRDYGTGMWEGGDPDCDHIGGTLGRQDAGRDFTGGGGNREGSGNPGKQQFRDVCGKCGARRQDQQLGLEPTPDAYVTNMVAVFREVRRVLADHGTCWVNLGDSYASAWACDRRNVVGNGSLENGKRDDRPNRLVGGLKEKDLVGIPWRVAFALQQPWYAGRIKDERERIWLAAVVEAEGCLFIHKRGEGQYASTYTRKDGTEAHYHRKNATYGSGMEVSSTDRVIVERCLAITGAGSICEQSPKQNDRRKQTIYRWNVRSNECRWIIEELYPHFYAKQHEARLLISCPSSGPDAEKAHSSLKALHNGQTPDIDFAPPKPLWEPGWFLRSDVIWAKPQPHARIGHGPADEGTRVRVPADEEAEVFL